MSLSEAQVAALLQPIKPHRVLKAQGQSHVPAYDVIAHLSRMFGFGGWDKEILDLSLVHERHTEPKVGADGNHQDQGRWWVTYRCSLRLTVRDVDGNVLAVREDAATGTAQNQPSPGDAHDMAIKAAVSYAVKRCAKDWGDQFGLSLYNAGQTKALVGKTLERAGSAGDLQQHAPEPRSLGNDELDPERPFTDDEVAS